MRLRRFEEKTKVGRPHVLADDHPAVVEGRSLFTKAAGNHSDRVLISGVNSKKIGARVMKGRWKGMPIYTLTLEERKTCPRSCTLWNSCYGNRLHWSRRLQPGADLEARLAFELERLDAKHSGGFVVRLHVLGDFYSVEYVKLWASWLKRFPTLRVFGYTARRAGDPIGFELTKLALSQWDRFAVRSSGGYLYDVPATVVAQADVPGAVTCPAQTGRTDCCSTCALCWEGRKTVAFLEH